MRSLLLFDFDGTVALGEGPVLAYAQHVATALNDDGGLVAGIRAALSTADDDALDGYDAVRRAAEELGADAALLSAAYLSSRHGLATASAPIAAPAGLAGFLASVPAHVERVLVTNAPAIRLPEALDALGLAGLFDRIVADARKPAGLGDLLDALPAGTRVLSIGDIWHNDLAPAHERGHATALIAGFADPRATPTFRARDFASLIPEIDAWVRLSVPTTFSSPLSPTTLTNTPEG